eukprot:5189513-Alexandrium_andersonii.AAC.1
MRTELGSEPTRHSGATHSGRSKARNPVFNPPAVGCRRGRLMSGAIEVLDVIEAQESRNPRSG